MPPERLRRRAILRLSRDNDFGAMQFQVVVAVVEIVPHPGTRFDAVFWGYGDIAGIEEAVQIGAEEEAVADVMALHLVEGADMRGVERGERLGRFIRKTLSFSKFDEVHEITLRLFLHEYNLARVG